MSRKTQAQARPGGEPRLAYSAQKAKRDERKAKRCVAITKAGDPCPRPQMAGLNVCNFHREGGAARAGQIGGHRRSIFNPDDLAPFAAPRSVDEVIAAVSTLAEQTYKGKLDPRVSQVVGTHMNTLLNALEVKEFGVKLKALAEEVGLANPLDLIEEARTPLQ